MCCRCAFVDVVAVAIVIFLTKHCQASCSCSSSGVVLTLAKDCPLSLPPDSLEESSELELDELELVIARATPMHFWKVGKDSFWSHHVTCLFFCVAVQVNYRLLSIHGFLYCRISTASAPHKQ